MSFRLNNVNYSCAPMFNQNNNNNVMGYLCSTKNVEGFYNFNLIDNTPSANKGNVRTKDEGSYWKYMGAASIVSGITNESNNMLKVKFNDGNGDGNKTGLNKLISGFGVSAQLPFIFQFYDGNTGKAFVFRTANWSISGNELSLTGSKSNGIVVGDFNQLKEIKSVMQLRVGVYDVNNGTQRNNIESKWN